MLIVDRGYKARRDGEAHRRAILRHTHPRRNFESSTGPPSTARLCPSPRSCPAMRTTRRFSRSPQGAPAQCRPRGRARCGRAAHVRAPRETRHDRPAQRDGGAVIQPGRPSPHCPRERRQTVCSMSASRAGLRPGLSERSVGCVPLRQCTVDKIVAHTRGSMPICADTAQPGTPESALVRRVRSSLQFYVYSHSAFSRTMRVHSSSSFSPWSPP
jgi:hypothetical protein